jgi:hypothetical protein
MSDNKLLAENTIRRFMKLANVDTLTDKFIAENNTEEVTEEVEETNEEVVNEEETVELEEQEEEEMEMDVEMGEEPMEDEPEMEEPEMDEEPALDVEPEMGAADMSLSEDEAQLLIDLGQRLAAAIGGAAEAPAEEPELDMEPEMEEEPMEEPEMEEEEEEPAYRMDEEALVNEVLKRVTKRLVAEKLKNRK